MFKPVTAAEFFTWIETHDFIWYHAPMDVHPSRIWLRSKIQRWKRDLDRFSVMVEKPGLLRFRIDNSHLDRLRIPDLETIVIGNKSPTRYLPCTEFVDHGQNELDDFDE